MAVCAPPASTHLAPPHAPACSANARNGIGSLNESLAVAEQRGDGWRGSIRNHFSGRVSARNIGVFPNKV